MTKGNGETPGEYRVQLEVYEGPLDLLLHLIERQEMDITQVSLARIADQYLEYIATMEQVTAESLADFLVIAARLLLIKSRALLPRPPVAAPQEEEQVGQDLVEQLKLYRQFKQAATFLQGRAQAGLRSYPRVVPLPKLERHLETGDVSVGTLAAMMRQVLRERQESAPLDQVIAPLLVSIDDKIAYIAKLVSEQSQLSFRRLLQGCASRLEIIVTFLAILELLKQLRLQVRQERLFGEIIISCQKP